MRILIADDDADYRRVLCELLGRDGGLRVVGEAADGQAAVAMALRLRPDVALLDVAMPGVGGIEAARAIARAQPQIRLIAISMHADPRLVEAMREAGAEHYLLKENAARDLVAALRGDRAFL